MRPIWSVVLVAAACTDPPPAPTGPDVTSRVVTFDIPFVGRTKLDLLFVIDSSTAMAPYRDHVIAEIPHFADVLAAFPGGMPDLNIAVTTASSGGELRSSALLDGTYVVDGMRDGVRVRNYTGELAGVLTQLLDVGTTQVAAPQPFDAMSLAVPDFVRDNAYFGIITIAGADDASSMTAQSIAGGLKSMKDDPANVMAIGIHDQPAPRLDAFLAQFPNRSSFTAIDATDLTAGFASLASLRRVPLGAPCVDPLLDVDPVTPGEQYDCVIEEEDIATGMTSVLPRCGAVDVPCWDLEPGHVACFSPGSLYLRIDHGSEGLPYEGYVIHGQCLSQ